MNDLTQRISLGKLIAGAGLLALGIAGALDWREIWRWWPLLLICLGVAREAEVLRTRRGDSGFILIAIGVWMLAGSLRLFGLDYRDAFPLAIVVAGIGLITHSLLGIERRKELRREQQ
ncbi:MAG TPA: hypothetical protein VND45_16160 [Thermoanaerobaculia bacterium]|jgi:hypothetical protein|nr:hypothetical protein [Thermoanaerobaculia bacterium]